jgi:spore coat polysaccharide biosynthesis predicted glycosyltransferase SpsG
VFAFCVEASHERGMGHLFRALVMADILSARGVGVLFVINEDARAVAVLGSRGFHYVHADLGDARSGWESGLVRSQGIGVWVNDRLDTSVEHARRVKEAGARLATFDDHGTGAALADLNVVSLSQPGEQMTGKRVLTGLTYLVIDPAIERYRRERSGLESRVVTMGGTDTYGLTVQVMRALKEHSLPATVILGPGFRHDVELSTALDARFVVKRGVTCLAKELAAHDLAITAGGITLFEAAAAGLPCVVIAAEPWERDAAHMLERLGACRLAGYRADFDASLLAAAQPVAQMSRAALAALDAGGAGRVAEELLAL